MRNRYFVTGIHNALLVIGVGGGLVSAFAILYQWALYCDMKISAINLVCQQPLNNRCGYEYWAVDRRGVPTKVDLGYTFSRQKLAVGDAVKKEKFSFASRLNGKEVSWEFATRYLVALSGSLLAFGLWRVITLKRLGSTQS